MSPTSTSIITLHDPLEDDLIEEFAKTIIPVWDTIKYHIQRYYLKKELHNSTMTGLDWVQLLRKRNGDIMQTLFGVTPVIPDLLLQELVNHARFKDSKYVTAMERLAILLHICGNQVGVRNAAAHFNRLLETITE
jgi:hypothetical protein